MSDFPENNNRSANENKVHVPFYNSNFANMSFKSAGPTLWNKLPQNIRMIPNLYLFKKKLKDYILSNSDAS